MPHHTCLFCIVCCLFYKAEAEKTIITKFKAISSRESLNSRQEAACEGRALVVNWDKGSRVPDTGGWKEEIDVLT
jgi:hypothetical protein